MIPLQPERRRWRPELVPGIPGKIPRLVFQEDSWLVSLACRLKACYVALYLLVSDCRVVGLGG